MDGLSQLIGAPGRLGCLGVSGQALMWQLSFDMEGASDDDYMEALRQLFPLIGMRVVDSLSYAPHALSVVHSNPVNLAKHPNKFDESDWSKNAGVAVVQINERQWKYTEAVTSNLGQIITTGVAGQRITQTWRIAKMFSSSVGLEWLRLARWSGPTFLAGMVNIADGTKGEAEVNGDGVVYDYGVIDRGDEWEIFLTTSMGAETVSQFDIHTAQGGTVIGGRLRVEGAEFLLAEFMCYPGDRRDLPFQNNDGVGALDNWVVGGDPASGMWLEFNQGQFRYVLDNTGGVAEAQFRFTPSNLIAGIPHSGRATLNGTGSARVRRLVGYSTPGFTPLTDTPTEIAIKSETASVDGSMLIELAAGSRAYTVAPECVEGGVFFGLPTVGYERHMIRRKQGVGALYEPDGMNKCQNNSIAPTGTASITDGAGTVTTAWPRNDPALPQAFWDGLDAEDPDGTVAAVLQTVFTGTDRLYVTGPTGNLNVHHVDFWGYLVSGGPVSVGIENANVDTDSTIGAITRFGGNGTPLATADRLSIEGTDATLIWFGAQMSEGGERRSLTPVAGSSRTRNADRIIAKADSVGIDRRRNSAPDSQTISINSINGWTLTQVGTGKTSAGTYWDIRCQGTITGATFMYVESSATTIPAASGQPWWSALEASIIAGDLTNVTEVSQLVAERDVAGALLNASNLPMLNVLGSDLRRMAVFRQLSNAATAFMNSYIQLNGSGAVDFTIRVADWSLQRSADLLPHIETSGAPIEFKQWDDGLTIVDHWDLNPSSQDFQTTVNLYGTSNSTDRITNERSGGAGDELGALTVVKDGAAIPTTPATSVVGDHVQQTALSEGDEEYWIDGISQGTLAVSLPTDIDTIMLGDSASSSRNADGVQKSIIFIGERKVTA